MGELNWKSASLKGKSSTISGKLTKNAQPSAKSKKLENNTGDLTFRFSYVNHTLVTKDNDKKSCRKTSSKVGQNSGNKQRNPDKHCLGVAIPIRRVSRVRPLTQQDETATSDIPEEICEVSYGQIKVVKQEVLVLAMRTIYIREVKILKSEASPIRMPHPKMSRCNQRIIAS